MSEVTQRLHSAISAVCPIEGISVGIIGDSSSVKFFALSAATAQQKTAAQNAINTFDWSASAQTTFDNLQARITAKQIATSSSDEGKTIRAVASVLLDMVNALRAAASPPQSQITLAQLRTLIANKIDSGTVD